MSYFCNKIRKAFLFILLVVLSSGYLSAKSVVIKLATLAPEGSDWYQLLVELSEKWFEATHGAVRVRIYPGGVAGDERDIIRKIRIGQFHAAAVTIEGLTEITADMNVFYIPLLVENIGELNALRDQLTPQLSRELEKNEFKLLSWADVGWAYWFTRKPIKTPDDLRKLKLFTWAGDYISLELWKKAGYHPVPLASLDILTSLQTGMIDALAATPLVALSFQWFALAHHMLDLKWGFTTGAIIMSKEMWEKIPPVYHQPLLDILREIEKKTQELADQLDPVLILMQERGLQIHTITLDQKKEWIDLSRELYPLIRGTLIPAEIFDKAIKIRQELDSRKLQKK